MSTAVAAMAQPWTWLVHVETVSLTVVIVYFISFLPAVALNLVGDKCVVMFGGCLKWHGSLNAPTQLPSFLDILVQNADKAIEHISECNSSLQHPSSIDEYPSLMPIVQPPRSIDAHPSVHMSVHPCMKPVL